MTSTFLNKFNYYELTEKPSPEDLRKYYAEKYYQEPSRTYKKSYLPEEIKFIKNRLNRKYFVVQQHLSENKISNRFLDVGCGEGWGLSFFSENGWEVTGLDYSDAGCKNINPQVSPYLIKGNIYENLRNLMNEKKEFDVILLDNVLEHVLDPFELTVKLRKLVGPDSILIIESPNDFSILQKYLMDSGKINNEFWVVTPDHISYFNKDGLIKLLDAAGWENIHISTDFPIDINLLNEDTNYIKDKSKGRNVHLARIELENLLDTRPPELIEQLHSTYARIGLGRNLIGYFKPKPDQH